MKKRFEIEWDETFGCEVTLDDFQKACNNYFVLITEIKITELPTELDSKYCEKIKNNMDKIDPKVMEDIKKASCIKPHLQLEEIEELHSDKPQCSEYGYVIRLRDKINQLIRNQKKLEEMVRG